MKTFIELFNLAMLRNYCDIIPDVDHTDINKMILNLGAGKKQIKGTVALELPEWNAEYDLIPCNANSVDQIHAYHFLEHVKNVKFVISEMQRVLKVGGHVNICVPYYKSKMQYQDLDHKSYFTEKTFTHLFSTEYYDTNKLQPMKIATNFIVGDCEENLCLIIQLVKV